MKYENSGQRAKIVLRLPAGLHLHRGERLDITVARLIKTNRPCRKGVWLDSTDSTATNSLDNVDPAFRSNDFNKPATT